MTDNEAIGRIIRVMSLYDVDSVCEIAVNQSSKRKQPTDISNIRNMTING